MIWDNIKAELSGDFSRGYALSLYLGYESIERYTLFDSVIYKCDEVEFDDNTDAMEWDDYLVCTDEEADELAVEYIEDSLWAFNPSFLAGQTGVNATVFEALSKDCESANEPILSIIESTCGLESFTDAAISADGRGHFLNTYDGHEDEQVVGDNTYYIYRR